MDGAGILLVGMLALAAVLVLSAVIVALAPYVAATIIIGVLLMLVFAKADPKEPDKPDDRLQPPDKSVTEHPRRDRSRRGF